MDTTLKKRIAQIDHQFLQQITKLALKHQFISFKENVKRSI